MNDAIERLVQELNQYEDALWRLQNDALTLTLEEPDSQVIKSVVTGLGEIADMAKRAESRRLARESRHLKNTLTRGDDDGVFQRVFNLIEALVSLGRGEGSEVFEDFLDAVDDDWEKGVDSGAEMPSDPEIMDDYSGVDAEEGHFFCAEAREHLGASERLLVDLERTGSSASIDEIFRGFHSIKGGAQYLGLEATAIISHRLETLLDKIRRGDLKAKGEVVTLLLRGVDHLVVLIDGLESRKQPDMRPTVLLQALDACMAGESIAAEALVAPEAAFKEESAASEGIEADLGEREESWEEPFALGEIESSPEEVVAEIPENAESEDHRKDRELFATEYREHHDSARKLLEDLDSLINDQKAVALVTRNLHSLKGIAGFAGLVEMEILSSGIDLLVRSLGQHGGKAPHDARRAVDASLTLLEVVADDFLNGREISVGVDEEVEKLRALADREARVSEWSTSEIAVILESTNPMERFLGKIISAHEAGDEDAAIAAASSLEESATLHGYEDLAAGAAFLAREFSSLKISDRVNRLQGLRGLLPESMEESVFLSDEPEPALSFQELVLSIPGIGPKKLETLNAKGIIDRESARSAGIEGLSSVRGIGMEQAQALLSFCVPSVRIRNSDSEPVLSFDEIALSISGVGSKKLGALKAEGITDRASALSAGIEGLRSARGIGLDQAKALLSLCTSPVGDLPEDGEIETHPFEDLEIEISGDDYDRELVEIYLITNRRRLVEIEEALRASDTETALELFADSSAAAGYMGYGPYAEALEEAGHSLESAPVEIESVLRKIYRIATSMDRLMESLPRVEDGSDTVAREEVELEYIFSEAAQGHLEAICRDLPTFLSAMDETRLASLQHHLSCLEAASTNLDKGEVAKKAERMRGKIEDFWLNVTSLDQEGYDGLFLNLEQLHLLCDLSPPELARVEPSTLAVTESSLDEFAEDLDLALGALEVTDDSAERPTTEVIPPEDLVGTQTTAPPTSVTVPGGLLSGPSFDEPPSPPEGSGDLKRGLVEAQTTVRVDTEKIDDLMNMAAELVVNRSSFMALGAEMSDVIFALSESGNINKVEARNLRMVANRYEEVTTDLGRVSNQLQEGVMRIRMMPVKTLFARIPRLVRGLSLSEGKQVRVYFEGEDTELDKSVIEKLSDPLVHLIRNAVGHGLEEPGVRIEKGKAPEGRLKLTSRHEGNMVILEVEDDGRGIDPESVRQRLVEMEISTATEARRLSERDLSAALFLPGFSTAKSVGDISGRGVGLDVVKRNIEGLGGQVDVISEPDRFCRFSIRIPLTMAIMQALLVKVADEVFSIPVASVIQTVRVTANEVSTVDGQEVITIRDQVVSLVRIGAIFSYEYHVETGQIDAHDRPANLDGTKENGVQENDELYVVVLQGENQELGIVVDDLLGSQDIVIKSLDDELVDSEGVAGASILGDGTVTLILDVAEVQRMTVDRDRHQKKKLIDTFRRFEHFLRLDGRHGAAGPN